MRLRYAAVGVVLAAALAAGGLAAIAPARAASTDPAITIRAIDRAGRQVPVTAELQGIAGGLDDLLTSAHPTRVPAGSYNIAAWVYDQGNGAPATLADREITITRPMTVTFDARAGRLLWFKVNDPAASMNRIHVAAYSSGIAAFPYASSSAFATYLIPGKLPHGWKIFAEAELVDWPASGPAPRPAPATDYILIRQLSGSIPANLTFSSDKAALATERLTVRQVDPHGTGYAALQPTGTAVSSPGILPSDSYGQSGPGPFSISFRVTPGYAWMPCASFGDGGCDDSGPLYRLPVLAAGRHYGHTFGTAVLGPTHEVTAQVSGSRLRAGSFQGQGLFVDSALPAYSLGIPAAAYQTWLYEGGKLLAHSSGNMVTVKNIAPATRWYHLRISARRGAGAGLSRSAVFGLNFAAHAVSGSGTATPDTFWPRLVPRGLNWRNAARPGTKTTVPIWFTNEGNNVAHARDLAVHGVRAWASVNGGKTWRALRVTRSGYRRTVTVANPSRAGYVSLRVKGTDPAGSTASVTIINAYAVS